MWQKGGEDKGEKIPQYKGEKTFILPLSWFLQIEKERGEKGKWMKRTTRVFTLNIGIVWYH